MKYASVLLLCFCLVSCASCQVKPDVAESPSSLNQGRAVMQIDGQTEVGIHGFSGNDRQIKFRSYNSGTVTIRGLGDCGFVTSGATKSTGWIVFNTSVLPHNELCLFSVQGRTNGFDAPVIGHFLIRRFHDPNILPLETTMNHVRRLGVNWVQLRAETGVKAIETMAYGGGIYEDRVIVAHVKGQSGLLNITGCDMQPEVREYTGESDVQIRIDDLYRKTASQHVDRDCTFTVTANHNGALKQSATVLVRAYSGAGSFLDAPVMERNAYGEMCARFQDAYVVGSAMNGKWKRSGTICTERADRYVVEGVTSRHRIFYGIFNGSEWTEMK